MELVQFSPGMNGPIFAAAGRLGLPVTIHTGDPQAFWLPNTSANERYAELSVHPGWSFHGQPVPSWESLWTQFATRVRRHPKTTFIGVHFYKSTRRFFETRDKQFAHPTPIQGSWKIDGIGLPPRSAPQDLPRQRREALRAEVEVADLRGTGGTLANSRRQSEDTGDL